MQTPSVIIEARKDKNTAGVLFPVVAILVVPFIYSTLLLDPGISLRYAAFSIFLFAYLILFSNQKLLATCNSLFHKVIGFYLIYIGFVFLSILWAGNFSEAIYVSFNRFLFLIFLILSVLILRTLRNPQTAMVRILVLFSLIISAVGFYQMVELLIIQGWDHQISYKISLVFGHRNLYSQLLMLCFPFTIAGIVSPDKFWKTISSIAAFFSVVLIVMLLVKSVWAGFLASIFSGLIIFILSGKREQGFRRLLIKTSFFIVLLVVLITLIIAIWSKYNSSELFAKQTAFISNYKFGSSLERVDMWTRTLYMIGDNPVTGVGSGNWRFHFPAYGMQGMRSEEGIIHFQRPHNDFLWIWSETGTPGFLFFALVFGSILYYLFRILRNRLTLNEKVIFIAIFSAVISYLIIAMLSFPYERVEHNLILHLLFALVILKYDQIMPARKKTGPGWFVFFRIMAIIIVAFAAFLNITRVRSEFYTRQAFSARSNGEHDEVIRNISKAYSRFSTVDPTATPLPWYSGSAHFNLNHVSEAFSDFDKALKIHPNHIHVLNNFATCNEIMGNHKRAVALYRKALEIAPGFTDACLNLAAAQFNQKENDKALTTMARCQPDTVNQKYEKYLSAILTRKTNNFIKSIDDPYLKMTTTRIRNSDEWMKKVFYQSLNDSISYVEMLKSETIYLLEKVDSAITSKEAKVYRKKFGLPVE